MKRMTLAAALALILGTSSQLLCAAQADTDQKLPVKVCGHIDSKEIKEASGLAAGRVNKDTFWTHNDSGDSARILAISSEGTFKAQFELKNVDAVDIEDIAVAVGPQKDVNYIYLADIGANTAERKFISIYRFAEPKIKEQKPEKDSLPTAASQKTTSAADDKKPDTVISGRIEKFDTLKFEYPDGMRDAETVMVDPVTKDIFIVSKREKKCRLYVSKFPQSTTEINKLEFICELDMQLANGGDISADGSQIIVRNYNLALLWNRLKGQTIGQAMQGRYSYRMLIPEPQGESISFSADGKYYFTTSEYKKKFHKKKGIPVYRYLLNKAVSEKR